MSVDESSLALLKAYASLPPKTRLIVRMACERPELSLVDIGRLCGIKESNLRGRMHDAYRFLQLEGRVDVVARLGPLLAAAYTQPVSAELE